MKKAVIDISKYQIESNSTDIYPHVLEDSIMADENKQGRLGNCEVCRSKNAQYTCPRCEIKTCSADCVKIHKKELECNGDRDKVGFVPLSKFDNLTLLNDYRLLEDVSRTIDNCKRNPLKKYTRYNKPLPPHLYGLRKEAFRRKTTIQYLPQHFTRHKENTTFLHFESKIIYWRLELIFPQSDNIKIVVEKCDETERLSSVLSKFIEYDNCPELYRKSLRFYHSAGLAGLEVLLKAENVKAQPSFFVLDMSSTLKENFEDRIIIEYPILYVIHKSHKDEYEILDADMKIECNSNRNTKGGRRFLEYTPFTYFDTVSYSKNPSKGCMAMRSINSSAAELKKYFSGCGSEGDTEEESEDFPRTQKYVKRQNKLNIPTYENLIKQNS